MNVTSGWTIEQYQDLYRRGEASPSEVIAGVMDDIDSKDSIVRAFLHLCREEAFEDAERLERYDRESMPLFGIPVAVKDNICTRGIPTTCASRILSGYIPPYDATVVTRLKKAGAVIVGKTNLDEFAMGSSTENSAFFPTRNPWNEDCTPGGSSGGSAAAVAAGMVPVARGSDTGGSIRQPAAFCGVTGLKGTYGRVSRYGLIAFASSLDQIGPITACVRDAAMVMEVIAGRDPLDSTSMPGDCRGLTEGLMKGMDGIRFAIPEKLDRWRLEREVREAFDITVKRLGSTGASVSETGLPDMEASIACYYVLANAEASSNLARFDGVRYGKRADSASVDGMYRETRGEGFGDEVKRRILLGTYVLSSGYYDDYYLRARKVRRYIIKSFDEIFMDHDIVLMPATPEPPFELGERADDPVAMYLSDIFTTPASIAGLPALTIPAALTSDGLPVGVQLVAGRGGEEMLMRAAASLESILRFSDMVPGKGDRPGREG